MIGNATGNGHRFTKRDLMYKALLALAAASGLANLVAEALRYQPAIYLTKPLTTALLVAVALAATPPLSKTYQTLVTAGLAFSLAGDVFLMLPDDQFVPGLASFLVAHLCYTAAFFRARDGRPSPAFAVPFAVFGTGMLIYLWPSLAMLKVPVACYVLVIQIMAWQAWSTWGATRRKGALLAAIGAGVFLVSDSLLAIDRFRGHFSGARVAVMLTYFAAQWLIAASVKR
jgi:uncharacterized membrane protein YhhN